MDVARAEAMTGASADPAAPRRRRAVALALALAALGAIAHHRTLVELARVWQTNDNYSHGPLVPIASIVLAWAKRRELAALPIRPGTVGVAVVAAACLLQVLGVRGDVFALQGLALVLLVAGIVMTAFGTRHARLLAFPLAFLAFMLTFPPGFVNQLSFALKEATVGMSTTVAEWLGVAFQRSGMVLHLATGELRIENPCSGLRSLVALIATGALFAYLQPGAWWRRVPLLVAAIPIAVLANAVRTTLLIVVAHYDSIERAGGFIHDASGVMLYAVALAGMLALRSMLAPDGRAAGVPA